MTSAVDKPESVGMSASRLERIRPAMQGYIDRGVYAGITTLIARRGAAWWREVGGRGAGLAAMEPTRRRRTLIRWTLIGQRTPTFSSFRPMIPQ